VRRQLHSTSRTSRQIVRSFSFWNLFSRGNKGKAEEASLYTAEELRAGQDTPGLLVEDHREVLSGMELPEILGGEDMGGGEDVLDDVHVWVTFELSYECKFGQGMFLVGEGDDNLGGWKSGVPMKWTAGDSEESVWKAELLLPAGHTVMYKYTVRAYDDLHGQTEGVWQPGANRRLDIPRVPGGAANLAHQTKITAEDGSSLTFRFAKLSLEVCDDWLSFADHTRLRWTHVDDAVVDGVAIELERHSAGRMTEAAAEVEEDIRIGERVNGKSFYDTHIGDFRDLPPDEQAHVERALLKHMEEYEQTTDLLEELVDIVQTANRVHEEHGKASVESFTVDRAIAAAVDAAIFLVQKQNQALLGGGRAQALPQAE